MSMPPEGPYLSRIRRRTTRSDGSQTEVSETRVGWNPQTLRRGVAALLASGAALAVALYTRHLNEQPQAGPATPGASASPFPDTTPSPLPHVTFTLAPTGITTEPTSVATTTSQQFGASEDCGKPYDYTFSHPDYSEMFSFWCTPKDENDQPIGEPMQVKYRKERATGNVILQVSSRTVEGERVTISEAEWEETLAATTVAPNGCLATVTAGPERPIASLACPIE